MLHVHISRLRITRSPSASRRVDIRISDIAMSAVASTSTPGVLVKITPRSTTAGTSTLS